MAFFTYSLFLDYVSSETVLEQLPKSMSSKLFKGNLIFQGRPVTDNLGITLERDGYKLRFQKRVAIEEAQVIADKYEELLRRSLSRERGLYLLKAFLFWAVPCAALYAFGWGIGWVRRGFRES